MTTLTNCLPLLTYELNHTVNVNLLSTYILRSQDPWTLVHSVFPFFTFVTFVVLFGYLGSVFLYINDKIASKEGRSERGVYLVSAFRNASFAVLWGIVIFFFMSIFGFWEAFVEPVIASVSMQITHDFPSIVNNTDPFSKVIAGTWFGEKLPEIASDYLSDFITGIIFPLQLFYTTRTYPWIVLTRAEIIKRTLLYVIVFILQALPMVHIQNNTCKPLFEETTWGVAGINFIPVGTLVYVTIMFLAIYLLYSRFGRSHWYRYYIGIAIYVAFVSGITMIRFTGIIIQVWIAYLVWFACSPYLMKIIFGSVELENLRKCEEVEEADFRTAALDYFK